MTVFNDVVFVSNLKKLVQEYPFLVHAKNMIVKYESTKGDDLKKKSHLVKIMKEYDKYLKNNLTITGFSDSEITARVNCLNEYYDFLYNNNYDLLYSAQGKFRPTILEEFMSILFRPLVCSYKKEHTGWDKLICFGSTKAYTNLFFLGENFIKFIECPDIGINVKDQDFAISRRINLRIDGMKEQEIFLPVIAIENKTFLDKTMLEGAIATAEKVKSGNPYCMFFIVTETYDVAMDVDPKYSRIDQIYVLRKTTRRGKRNKINADVVIDLVKQVSEHFQRPWSDIEAKLQSSGKLL